MTRGCDRRMRMATKKASTKKRIAARPKAPPSVQRSPVPPTRVSAPLSAPVAPRSVPPSIDIDPPRIDEGCTYIATRNLLQVQRLFDTHRLRKLEAEVIVYRIRDEKERHAAALAALHQDHNKATQLASDAHAALTDLENAIADAYGMSRDYSYEPTTGKIFEKPKATSGG